MVTHNAKSDFPLARSMAADTQAWPGYCRSLIVYIVGIWPGCWCHISPWFNVLVKHNLEVAFGSKVMAISRGFS